MDMKKLFHQEILCDLFYHLLKSSTPANLFSYPFDTTIHKHIHVHTSSSSSSCIDSTDFPDYVFPFVPIIHCTW